MSKKKKNKTQNSNRIQKKKQKKQATELKSIIAPVQDSACDNEALLPEEADTEQNDTLSADCSDSTASAEADDNTSPENAIDKTKNLLTMLKDTGYITVFKERMDDIWNFISETRKISVPLIILIYTAIIVSITIPIEHARVLKQINQQTQELEQITNSENSITVLEKDYPAELASGNTVVYTGYEFTDTVKGTNSDEFGSTYENDSELNTYLDIILEYTHNSDTPVPADKIAAMTAKAGSNQYASFAAVETEDGKDIEFANNIEINPGETVKIHYIFTVPKELQTNEKNLVADVAFDKNTYTINIK